MKPKDEHFLNEKFVNEFEFKVNQINKIEVEAKKLERQRLKEEIEKLGKSNCHCDSSLKCISCLMIEEVLALLEDKK